VQNKKTTILILGECCLCDRDRRLFDQAENKLMSVADMFVFG